MGHACFFNCRVFWSVVTHGLKTPLAVKYQQTNEHSERVFFSSCQFFSCWHWCLWCFCVFAGPEEDDVQVADKSYCQYAKSLPLPVCQPPAGMDSVPLQYAFLYRFHGTGIDLHVSPVSFLEFQIIINQ